MFSVAQAGLDLIVILLPQLPKLWDYGVCSYPALTPNFGSHLFSQTLPGLEGENDLFENHRCGPAESLVGAGR